MSRPRRFFVPLGGWLAALLLVAAGADPAPRDGEAAILLLRNGELIRGRIKRAGNHYDVAQSDGEIHVQATEVEAVCQDLADCYRVKRSHVSVTEVDDHLALAEWCIRNALFAEAAMSLRSAAALDARHPKIALLERRMSLAGQKPPEPAATHLPIDAQPSGEELDRTVRGLPPRAVEQFTMQIQPLLLNHCSTAGCHGPQSTTSFHLLRLPSGRTAGRRTTQRNLYTTLTLIDRNEPGNSRLLTAPATPHGTAKMPVFNKHETSHYRRLVEWVYLVSSQTPEPPPEQDAPTADKPPAHLPAGMETARPLVRRRGAEPFVSESALGQAAKRAGGAEPAGEPDDKPSVVPATAEFPTGAAQPPTTARSSVKRGAKVEEFVPKDEFDPEIFNRQR